MIAQIIEVLRGGNFYGAGEYTEIAKGKNEMVTGFRDAKNKIVRQWRSRGKYN